MLLNGCLSVQNGFVIIDSVNQKVLTRTASYFAPVVPHHSLSFLITFAEVFPFWSFSRSFLWRFPISVCPFLICWSLITIIPRHSLSPSLSLAFNSRLCHIPLSIFSFIKIILTFLSSLPFSLQSLLFMNAFSSSSHNYLPSSHFPSVCAHFSISTSLSYFRTGSPTSGSDSALSLSRRPSRHNQSSREYA